MNLLKIQNLRLDFSDNGQNTTVLHGVDLELVKGSFTALVGESGSGKTLTALSVLKLLPQTANIRDGQIFLHTSDGETDLFRLSSQALRSLRAKKIAMIFQNPQNALNPLMTVGEQVLEVILAHEIIETTKAKKRVFELLQQVGLQDVALRYEQYPHQLSGGQCQRVMIAMALACRPEILVADEPTTALDVTVQAQILELLQRLQREYELTILFVTHDFSIVAQYANHVFVMQKGVVVEHGSAKTVLQNPQHDYTKALLLAMPDRPGFLVSTDQPQNQKVLYELSGVNKSFLVSDRLFANKRRVSVLSDINLSVYENEILGIVGESGSGKSTLAKVMLKLDSVDSGGIRFDDRDITQISEKQMRLYRPHLQMIFQDPVSSLNPKMTIHEILSEPVRLYQRLTKPQILDKILGVLGDVGLGSELLQRRPGELSGGQCQRIAIARALLLGPKVLFADEATSALDVITQKQILQFLQNLRATRGVTIVFIAHNLDLVREFCDRVCVMYMGRIMEILPAKALPESRHPYTQSLWLSRLSSDPTQPKTLSLLSGEMPSLFDPPSGCVFQTRCPHFMDVCETDVPQLCADDANFQRACHLSLISRQ